MKTVTVGKDGRITLPRALREQLGIRKGSRVALSVVEGHVELHVEETAETLSNGGFGMLKSKRKAVPVDLDPASLIKP